VSGLPANPNIYEINTRVWIEDLRLQYGRMVTLATVPPAEWDAIAMPGFDAVWLMGVWQRSPAGAALARGDEGLLAFGRSSFPDFTPDDIVGSPYCVRGYLPDEELGGIDGLTVAREELGRRHLGLILDYVPNHVARDNPWVVEHPGYFIRGTGVDLAELPNEFALVSGGIFAMGRDPYFAPWTDVLQLNAFSGDVRRAAAATLNDIAGRCDGVRCDMAMLMMNDVFARTWGSRTGPSPYDDFWPDVIGAVKAQHPGFVFIAEAYWDLEWALLQQGFDFCYDKRLYDRLVNGEPEAVKLHLAADYSYQRGLLRFLENHDEPRASAVLAPAALRAAAVTVATLPGACLFHQGQFTGRTLRLPVQLRRSPPESADLELEGFYKTVVAAGRQAKSGDWTLCPVGGWPDNDSCRSIAAWSWQGGPVSHVIVVNLRSSPAQGRVQLPPGIVTGDVVVLTDVLRGDVFERPRAGLAEDGLYVGLDGYSCHFLRTGT
jgi:hypothetical protein